MTGDDVSPREDPRNGGGPGDDPAVDEILDGRRRPETEDEMSLDRLLGALRAPGTADELRGLEATSAAFLSARAEAAAAPGPTLVGGTARRPLAAAGVAVAAVLASVTFVGAAAAAYTGSLPRAAQEWAHEHIGAPSPGAVESTEAHGGASSHPASTSHGSGPAVSATDHAVLGQCVAYTNRPPGVAADAVAVRNLVAAAKAAGKSLDAYCSDVLATGSHGPTARPTPGHKPTAKPTPGHKPTAKPTPGHKPTAKPTPGHEPTARPTPGHEPTARPTPGHEPTAKPTPSHTRKPSTPATSGASDTRPATPGSGR